MTRIPVTAEPSDTFPIQHEGRCTPDSLMAWFLGEAESPIVPSVDE